MLDLPGVTLVAIHTVCHDLTRTAIEDCMNRVRFGDVKVFTDRPSRLDDIRVEPFADLAAAGAFTTYQVPRYIRTSHALFIHWDSWVTNPDAWRPEFLEHDYVGAPWWYRDGLNVGNSGFCLRSKALLDFLAARPNEFPVGSPEDHVLCRHYRPRLTQFSWAPEKLAWRFAFERTVLFPPGETFGFHGLFNWPLVLRGEALEERLSMVRADPYARSRPECRELRQLAA